MVNAPIEALTLAIRLARYLVVVVVVIVVGVVAVVVVVVVVGQIDQMPGAGSTHTPEASPSVLRVPRVFPCHHPP